MKVEFCLHFSDDTVFMPNEEDRQEYVVNDQGYIFRQKPDGNMKAVPWNFGQYEQDVLDSTLMALIDVAKIPIENRMDPIMVARYLSAAVSSNKQNLHLFFFFKYLSIFVPSVSLMTLQCQH